ncbi:MAG TPA: hypothetical protein VKE70_06085 [Candidatus Solibacter sp.]|nr:hypothetical protein [Candidatus Solibacter sp.]
MARQMNPTAGELNETLAEIADLAEEALWEHTLTPGRRPIATFQFQFQWCV